ncbi:type IV secretion system DNA-binding domain-containing protein [Pirellulaceae bacterium SH449]
MQRFVNAILGSVLGDFSRRPRYKNVPKGKRIQWANLMLPHQDASNHFIAIGTTGSGKTTILRLLMQSALSNMGNENCRAFVYDAKQDAYPILASFLPIDSIVTLNPFDDRGVAWDLCSDLNEPARLLEFCSTIYPQVADSNPFFRLATVHCTYLLGLSYYLSGLEFTFGDLLRPLQNISHLCQILDRHPETRVGIGLYFRDERLVSNLLASFAVSTLYYSHIAACWENAVTSLSIRDWVRSRKVVILGNSEISRASIDNINQAIFKFAAIEVLNLPETFTDSTWFFLDELSEAGKHEILISLAKKGRSKGAKLCLATQSIAGLRNPKLYGPELTDDLLGQIGTRFIGRTECVTTAEYLSRLLGDLRKMQVSYSYTSGEKPTSTTSYSEQIRKNILPSKLMNIPMANKENGITGYVMSPRYGCFKTHLDGTKLFDHALIPIRDDVPHYVARPAKQQILTPWTADRARYFGVDLEQPFELKGFAKSIESNPPLKLPDLSIDPLAGMFNDGT